jgi:hypothetical protein
MWVQMVDVPVTPKIGHVTPNVRMAAVASGPSMLGITKSINTASKNPLPAASFAWAVSTAQAPSSASSHVWWSFFKILQSILRLIALSSTTNT